MATNPYFESSFTARDYDQQLTRELIIEAIQIHGRDYYYLPRTLQNFDKFFGEDASSAFRDVGTVEMYLENVQGWEGESSFLGKFGMEIRDEATLVVSRQRWAETVGQQFGLSYPREGDIVVFPFEVDERVRAFEITWVDDEPTFYQLGKIDMYRIKCTLYEYSGEEFDTGVENIDSYNQYQYAQRLQLKEDGVGSYQLGEIVKQGNNWEALVLDVDSENFELTVSANKSPDAEAYNPDVYLPIIGQSSNAVWYLDVVENDAEHAPISDNEVIQNEMENILSFDEHNPFSGH